MSSFAGSLAKLLERCEASILYEHAAKRIANIIDKKKEAIYMDKNPKHPLKKRKVQQKVNPVSYTHLTHGGDVRLECI